MHDTGIGIDAAGLQTGLLAVHAGRRDDDATVRRHRPRPRHLQELEELLGGDHRRGERRPTGARHSTSPSSARRSPIARLRALPGNAGSHVCLLSEHPAARGLLARTCQASGSSPPPVASLPERWRWPRPTRWTSCSSTAPSRAGALAVRSSSGAGNAGDGHPRPLAPRGGSPIPRRLAPDPLLTTYRNRSRLPASSR